VLRGYLADGEWHSPEELRKVAGPQFEVWLQMLVNSGWPIESGPQGWRLSDAKGWHRNEEE
jgi:hypothetical protein